LKTHQLKSEIEEAYLDKSESTIRDDDGALINEGDGTQSDET
jgi:hypothetical protein